MSWSFRRGRRYLYLAGGGAYGWKTKFYDRPYGKLDGNDMRRCAGGDHVGTFRFFIAEIHTETHESSRFIAWENRKKFEELP